MLVYIFIVFFCIILFIIYTKYKKHKPSIKQKEIERIGKEGEETISKIFSQLNADFKILKNLYIPTIQGNTTEVDLVVITTKGLFVIETKNLYGNIYGRTNDENWYSLVNKGGGNKQKNYFRNPLKQNELHIKYINKCFSKYVPIYSIIVFTNRCSIQHLSLDNFETYANCIYVIQEENIKQTVRSILSKNKNIKINKNEIYKILKKYTHVSSKVKKKHYNYIQKNYK